MNEMTAEAHPPKFCGFCGMRLREHTLENGYNRYTGEKNPPSYQLRCSNSHCIMGGDVWEMQGRRWIRLMP